MGSEQCIMISSKVKKSFFLVFVAFSLGYVVWNSPLTVDDLYYEAYGLRRVSDIFRFAIAYGNGRLFGNMLIHFILWSPIFRVVLQTSVLVVLWFLTYKMAKPARRCSFYVCIALFLAISPTIMREAFLWSSAFANYIPGIIVMFASLYIVMKSHEISGKYIYIISLTIVSISGQLFVEHTSLINIVFAFCVLSYLIKSKAEKIRIVAASVWLGGAVTGMALMFMIPKLFHIANEWEDYQKININSLHDFVISIVANGMQIAGIYLQNVFALIILSVVVIALTNPKIVSKAVLLFVPVYGVAVNYIINDLWTGTVCGMISLLLLLLYVVIVVFNIANEQSINGRITILFFIGMSIFSVLPLLVVYPIGSRCLLHSYVFLVIAILSLINNVDKVHAKFDKNITVVCVIAVCLLSCFLVVHFYQVGTIDQIRLEYVQNMVDSGAETITVPKIPSVYVRDNNGWSYGQVFFREEKQDIDFEFVDYHVWQKLIQGSQYGSFLLE